MLTLDRHAPGLGGGADLDLALAVTKRTHDGHIVVSVDLVQAQKNILNRFQCHEVNEGGYLIPSHLVLTGTHCIKLREVGSRGGKVEAVVLWRRELAKVIKITAKKKHPNLLALSFECEAGEAADSAPVPAATADKAHPTDAEKSDDPPQHTERFLVPQYVEAKEAFRSLIAKVRGDVQ